MSLEDLRHCRVLVTPTSFGRHDKRLCQELESMVGKVVYNDRGRPLDSGELQELLPGCDGFIAGLDCIDNAALASADRLRVIARYGVGVDNIDLDAAAKRKITVTNTPHANATSVAELTIALLLALARSIPETVEAVREGEWPRLHGKVLEGKVFGLIGFGTVGKAVARRLQAWQLTLLACDPLGDATAAESLGVRLVKMDELIRESDFISLHAPLLAETRCMVNPDFFARVKPGAFLINTARGGIVDEGALLQALDSGQLGGAALDVYQKEPPPADSPLRRHPKVIAMPHCAAHTDGAADRMGRQSLHDCLAVLRGETPLYPVTLGVAA